MGAVIARPPLPSGPFLVVGLARSGVAAALALRKRGREVLGTDARAVDAGVRERLAAAGGTGRDGGAGGDPLGGGGGGGERPGGAPGAPGGAGARGAGGAG